MRALRVGPMFGVLVIVAGAITAIASPASAGSRSATMSAVRPSVSLSRAAGSPTSRVRVSGSGFGAFERVDLFLDQAEVVFTGTGARGHFGPIGITVPAQAVPGRHWISAWGRRSGRFVQRAFTVRTDWSTFHYSNQRTGSNPYENVLNIHNVSRLSQDWSFRIGTFVDDSSPAVANGLVYAATTEGRGGDNVFALNAATGAKRWSFFINSELGSSPAVADGLVYIGSQDNNRVYALNAATGAKRWSSPVGGAVFSAPAVARGVVYVGATDGRVYALNAATGKKRWSFTTAQSPDGDAVNSPTVAHGVVYVGSDDGKVYALNAATGKKLWSFTIRNVFQMHSSPAVSHGVVYVGSMDHNVYALDAATGAKLWNFTTGNDVESSSPAVANGVLYIGSDDGNLYALNAATGAKLWSVASGEELLTSPAVANGEVYISLTTGTLHAFHVVGGPTAPDRPSRAELHPNLRLRTPK